ncbi:unnamed protein product [Camellia sinensis]
MVFKREDCDLTEQSSPMKHEPPRCLNYLTSPHVVLWSAVAALCTFAGLFEAQELMLKEIVRDYGVTPKYRGTLWEKLSAIKANCGIELALECVAILSHMHRLKWSAERAAASSHGLSSCV